MATHPWTTSSTIYPRVASCRRMSALRSLLLVIVALSTLGQVTKPNFSGTWKEVAVSKGSLTDSIAELEESSTAVKIRMTNPRAGPTTWATYPINGKRVIEKVSRMRLERAGHWEQAQLVLEETGPGNAPWRKSTERRTLSLSGDGSIMTIQVHAVSDRNGTRDYSIQFRRIGQSNGIPH